MKNILFISSVRAWLNNIPIRDSVDRRMASLLQVILLGFMTTLILSFIINLFLPPENILWQVILVRSSLVILMLWIPLILLRRGHFRSSVLIIISIFLLIEIVAVTGGSLREIAETLSFFTLAMFLACWWAGRRCSLRLSLV